MSDSQRINVDVDLQHNFQPTILEAEIAPNNGYASTVGLEAEIAPKWLRGEKGDQGEPGKVYTPTISPEGEISWTLDDGTSAPTPAT